MVRAMPRAMTASSKPFSMAPWRVGDAVVGGGNAGLKTSKSGRPRLSRTSCKKDWKRVSDELSLMSPNDPIGQGTELN